MCIFTNAHRAYNTYIKVGLCIYTNAQSTQHIHKSRTVYIHKIECSEYTTHTYHYNNDHRWHRTYNTFLTVEIEPVNTPMLRAHNTYLTVKPVYTPMLRAYNTYLTVGPVYTPMLRDYSNTYQTVRIYLHTNAHRADDTYTTSGTVYTSMLTEHKKQTNSRMMVLLDIKLIL